MRDEFPDGGAIVSHGAEVQTAGRWGLWGTKALGNLGDKLVLRLVGTKLGRILALC